MRLMRRIAASLGLRAGLAAAAALGLAVLLSAGSAALLAGAAPALAATANPPGDTVASVVPSTATPGARVTFAVSCASLSTSSATLFGQTLSLPQQIPMNAGAADGDFTITVTLRRPSAGHLSSGHRLLRRHVRDGNAADHRVPGRRRRADR